MYEYVLSSLPPLFLPRSLSSQGPKGVAKPFSAQKITHQLEIDILDYPWADINPHTLRWWNIAMESPPLSSMIFPTINIPLVLLIYS